MTIRLEEKKDYFAVENLTREAFWNVYQPGCFEHLVLHNLRDDACFVPELDYVVEIDGKIIANIVYAKGNLELENGKTTELLLFGPVSVLPQYQKKGYGDQLIRFTLNKAKQMGYPAVVITGNPEYYKKFGFESASKYGLFLKGMDCKEDFPFFLIKVLDPDRVGSLKGIYSDPACYELNEEELVEFEKKFPPKVKEKRPGQLI